MAHLLLYDFIGGQTFCNACVVFLMMQNAHARLMPRLMLEPSLKLSSAVVGNRMQWKSENVGLWGRGYPPVSEMRLVVFEWGH